MAEKFSQAYLVLDVHDQDEIISLFLGSYGYIVKDSVLGHMPTTMLVPSPQEFWLAKRRRPWAWWSHQVRKGSFQMEKMNSIPSQWKGEMSGQKITDAYNCMIWGEWQQTNKKTKNIFHSHLHRWPFLDVGISLLVIPLEEALRALFKKTNMLYKKADTLSHYHLLKVD